MRRLVLFRHAKAERTAASGEDIDRGLTDRGRTDARLIGKVLHEAGVRPDLALVSAAKRTRQTWEAAAAEVKAGEVRPDRRLYNATSATLRKAVEAVEDDFETVVLVGHNPDLHQFAIEMLVEGAVSGALLERVKGKFPTASAIVFDMDPVGRPLFAGLYIPKEYGGGAED